MGKSKKQSGTAASIVAIPATPPEKGTRRFIRVKSVQEGFWRGGIQHSKAPAEYPVDQFDDVQLDRMFSEPKLTIEVIDRPIEKDGV
ncbi:MAG TPA: hypothetical protein VGG48_14215 [Rhizomicrobium sp.]|jgi:hypothetical protein